MHAAEQMDARLDKGRERHTKKRQSVPVYEPMLHLVPDKTKGIGCKPKRSIASNSFNLSACAVDPPNDISESYTYSPRLPDESNQPN